MKFHRLILLFLASSSVLFAKEPSRSLKDIAQLESKVQAVSQRVMAATVALVSEDGNGSGSGVITTKDGLILTAAHVVQGQERMDVVFPDGKQVTGKVLGANYSKDIAMVQITTKGPWPAVEMGNSTALTAGDWVIAMGHSAGFEASRTPPVRFGRVVSKGPGNFLTTDCTLIGGDSGGPLFDLSGKIVGINSSIGSSLLINNHAGIDGIREDWARIYASQVWGRLALNPFANPEMPTLGISMGLVRGVDGVPVESVFLRSPAAAAGVRAGDIIQALDDTPIPDGRSLQIFLAKRQSEDSVKLGILRENELIDIQVKLVSRASIFQDR
jgi:serine protease Do